MIPNRYQKAVFEYIQNGCGNAVINAVAGSGKTSTIVKALEFLPKDKKTLFIAFNKHIAEELSQRAPQHVEVSTLHSLGFRMIRKNLGWVKVNNNKNQNILWFDIFDNPKDDKEAKQRLFKIRSATLQLVALFKAHNIIEPSPREIDWLIDHFGINCQDESFISHAINTHKLGIQKKKVIDFDDMIFLPIYHDLKMPPYDYVFVDEAQDLSPAQIDLVHRVAKRVIAVGDTRQAIYGFRGASHDAIDNIVARFSADVLPLSICYRCARAIVEEAKRIVPQIESVEDAEEGQVTSISREDLLETVQEGDYVLCRTTAPIVQFALSLIRNQRKAIVKGREIGEGLLELVKHVDDLDEYEQQMTERIKDEARLVAIRDKVDTVRALLEAFGREGIEKGIEQLFSNNLEGVVCATIHRSKGLETDRVFLLHPELLPHPKCTKEWQMIQEDNLEYIAITRAMKKLYYVQET